MTEFEQKQRNLARFLFTLAYGTDTLDYQHAETIKNYMMDASDILLDYPHLLSLKERNRLDPEYPGTH